MKTEKLIVDNRKANYNYFILEEFVAGIVLKGCEIKSIREHNLNMSDAYCTLVDGELFVKNMHISPYKDSDITTKNLDPKRDRKLLLTKHELRKLDQSVKKKGNTIVPVLMFINEHGLVKVKIALAKGKHTYDKSKTIKERDLDRDMKNSL